MHRIFEFTAALCGLILLSPILLIISILIKLTSPGKIVFHQRRVGLNGKIFTLYKFRTMSETQKQGPLVTASSDNRITKIGRLLRKTKIDELPGLWNVVRGDMAIVGPRPEVPKFVDLDNALWQKILTARPGITDPVTLKLRNEEDLLATADDREDFYQKVLQPYKIKGYLKFIERKSFKTDIIVIYKTFRAIVLPKSAPPPSINEIKGDFIENY